MIPEPIGEQELQAYVDNRLDAARRAAVEAYLAEHPDEAKRVQAYVQQNRALADLFDPVLREAVPTRLQHATRRGGLARSAWRVGAMAASLAAAVALGWFAHAQFAPPELAATSWTQRALVAHIVYAPEILHPVEVDATQEQHLAAWLSKRLGANVRIPDLQAAGFRLVGGRLLPDAPKPAAQFMYESASGTRLTLYVNPDASNRSSAFRYVQAGTVGSFYWIDGSFGYALTGEVAREQLLGVAEAVYRALNPAG